MRPHGKPQTIEKRRCQAVRLLKQGRTYRSVAEKLNASLSSVVRWYQAYRKKGRSGLKARPNTGRPPLLLERQKKSLVQILVKGPLEAGYSTDLWTLKRIGQVVRKNFRVNYCVSNLWNLMERLGWSCQKPQKRAKERREQAIRYWKQRVWPHIKKGQTAPGPPGIPG
jgi:transposase